MKLSHWLIGRPWHGFPEDLRGWDWDSGEPQDEYERLLKAYLELRRERDHLPARRDVYGQVVYSQPEVSLLASERDEALARLDLCRATFREWREGMWTPYGRIVRDFAAALEIPEKEEMPPYWKNEAREEGQSDG